MYPDVVELRSFYESPLGRVTARLIRRKIRTLWEDHRDMDILGLGYAVPYLGLFEEQARRSIALMPAAQGVIHWPRHRKIDPSGNRNTARRGNLVALTDETRLPLMDDSMDRILLSHVLENTENTRALLREVWRTLAPGGRVLVMVPNRLGFWSRAERTPFGAGRPYSAIQLRQMLAENMLTPTRSACALSLPPYENRLMLKSMVFLENTAEQWFSNFAGVLLVEAEKQIYAANTIRKLRHSLIPAVNAPQNLARDQD